MLWANKETLDILEAIKTEFGHEGLIHMKVLIKKIPCTSMLLFGISKFSTWTLKMQNEVIALPLGMTHAWVSRMAQPEGGSYICPASAPLATVFPRP